MSYLKWLTLLPLMVVVTVLTYPLAFVLPFFAEERQGQINNGKQWGWGHYLPSWLSIFQTPDNSLDGDYGWQTEHWQWRFQLPKALCTYVGIVGWLWRNPGYGVGLIQLPPYASVTYAGNSAVNDSPGVEGYCFVETEGLFQLVWVKRISSSKCLYVNLGWNIKGLINDPQAKYTATYAFSPRISTWKE